MKHLIMGTAGHVDHGKTALIQALTGIDCDTHREEKARGITINLGFAHLELPSGLGLSIVDVPGHRDFVHTMVGGATGIDLALLVVASDGGVMPQTLEHLRIMDVLGIRDGLVALTKIDLADPDIADMAETEVRELIAGAFLEGAEIVRVSAVTGEGLDSLKDAIARVASKLDSRPAGQVFRLFPDRIFTVSGFGTVVTGSVLGGSLHKGDTAYLLPGGAKLRVRRLERHGAEVDQVVAGDRASINLVGLDREDFTRGMVVADRVLRSTTMADADLRLFQHGCAFGLWTHVVCHLGTYEQPARVHLIDRDRLAGGETGLVQIHLAEPCVMQYGDRFVIRNTSNDTTLGGGEIIDPGPLHHRRRTARVVESMAKVAQGKLPELIASEVRKRSRPISHGEVADILNISPDEVRAVVSDGLPEDMVLYTSGDQLYLVVRREHESLLEQILKIIAGCHRRHPLDEKGRTTEDLLGTLGMSRGSSAEATLRLMLAKLEADGKLKRVGHTWALFDHEVRISPELERRITLIGDFLQNCKMQTPLMSELRAAAAREGITDREIDHVLRYLVQKRQAYFIDGEYIHAAIVDRGRQMLLQELGRRGEGVTVAEFRDLVSGNRKICLLLLGIYNAEGVTERAGDLHVLTEKGRATIGPR